MKNRVTLVSSVVVPRFETGRIELLRIDTPRIKLTAFLRDVAKNFHSHPATVRALKSICPGLPDAERGYWNGEGWALAVRPRGGCRRAADNDVALSDLEAVLYVWVPA